MAEPTGIPESTLLEVMNSSPVVDGVVTDYLDDPLRAAALLRLLDGDASAPQVKRLRDARDTLQAITRSDAPTSDLRPYLLGIVRRPSLVGEAIVWEVHAPAADLPAARLVLAWNEIAETMPGRLRPCANPECTKFLIDHSKPNSARWCSMATCGNRLKARRHQARRASMG